MSPRAILLAREASAGHFRGHLEYRTRASRSACSQPPPPLLARRLFAGGLFLADRPRPLWPRHRGDPGTDDPDLSRAVRSAGHRARDLRHMGGDRPHPVLPVGRRLARRETLSRSGPPEQMALALHATGAAFGPGR